MPASRMNGGPRARPSRERRAGDTERGALPRPARRYLDMKSTVTGRLAAAPFSRHSDL